MRRWTRRLTLLAMATLALAAAGQPSANAACRVLDVTCQAGETVDVIEDVVSDDPIDTPLDDTIDPVVDPILDDVLDRVDDVGGEPIDIPDPIGGGGGSHVGGPPVDGEPRVTPQPSDRPGRGTAGARNPDGPGLTSRLGTTISASSGVAPSDTEDRTAGHRSGDVLAGIARGSAILLALFGLAVAFVAIQDRLDRHDPRLALAPIQSDVVEFA